MCILNLMYIEPEADHNIRTQPWILCLSLRRQKSELVVLMDYNSFIYIPILVTSTTSE